MPPSCRPNRRAPTAARALAILLGAFAGYAPTHAVASDLSWSGPVDCAQSEQLLFEIERALGAPLAVTGRVHLQVHVTRTAPNARALLRVGTDGDAPDSERSLAAPDCATLVDTLAVAITLAVEAASDGEALGASPDGEALGMTRRSPREPEPARASGDIGTPRASPLVSGARIDETADAASRAAARTSGRGPIPRVAAMVTGDVGSLPSPAVGVALGAQLDWLRFQLELVGTLWLEQHTQLASGALQGAGGDVGLATGTLWACTRPFGAGDPLTFALCAGGEVGRLSGSGSGVTQPRRASALWLAAHVQLQAMWRPAASRWGVGARAGAGVPLERDEFVLDRLETVHQAADLIARAALVVDVALD